MQTFPPTARPAVQELRASRIREVANAGMGRDDVVAFWFGEPDQVTPSFIRQVAVDALNSGDTFYTQNLGIPELRDAIAGYVSKLHRKTSPESIAVTNSGMSALMLSTQALVGHGDRVVIVTPVWPNLVEIPKILGADAVTFPLEFSEDGWVLDLDRFMATLTPGTCAVYINSPNNPTGWTIDAESQKLILEHCRRHGIWIVADDAYERLFFGDARGVAPSFLAIADTQDRLISVNTFSKAWLMTGWRLGWIAMPEALTANMATLIEYNTSCTPGFVQRAGVVAIESGDAVTRQFTGRLNHARDLLLGRLRELPGLQAAVPPGAMYAFFRVEGVGDSLAFCKSLIADFGLGLAPGIAFGPEGEGFVRWCFAASDARLEQGIERLTRALAHR